ncbi:hypothetical protein AVEN_32628-1 [Araneus ventricosus]|uniref:Uncharacterized protein n=1 Tax=Araneus ventricosus TaxID=182803 RepID=A0A4Y2C7F1_ARAVE|nr:hypothetical protein AVEN_32628-1 [Araneus ventricosus]
MSRTLGVICDNLAFTILIYAAIKLCLLVISYIYINQLEVFQRIIDSVAEGRRQREAEGRRELEAEERKLEAEERKLEAEKRKLEAEKRKLEAEERKSEAEASEKRN